MEVPPLISVNLLFYTRFIFKWERGRINGGNLSATQVIFPLLCMLSAREEKERKDLSCMLFFIFNDFSVQSSFENSVLIEPLFYMIK